MLRTVRNKLNKKSNNKKMDFFSKNKKVFILSKNRSKINGFLFTGDISKLINIFISTLKYTNFKGITHVKQSTVVNKICKFLKIIGIY